MKARCLAGCLERNRVFLDARGSKIVGETADGDHQRVVTEHALRRDLVAVLIEDGRHLNLLPSSVKADHLSKAVAEVVPVRLSQIIKLVHAQIPCFRLRSRAAAASTGAHGICLSAGSAPWPVCPTCFRASWRVPNRPPLHPQ